MRQHLLARALAAAFPLAFPLVISLGLCSHAQAQTTDIAMAGPDHNSKSLGIVEVTGSQPTSLPSQIPTTIVGITAAEIDAVVNATDSEDALKYFPSLLVRKRYIGDYNHAVLSTRASGTGNSARSLVFADGIQISNLLGNGAAFTPRWGLVTPEEIDRVDVLYGPFSAAYAGNSVGAVVDYVTRMPKAFEAHVKVGATTQPFELYNTKDTFGAQQASASIGDRAGGWAWWVNVNHLDTEGQPLGFVTKLNSTGSATVGGTTPVVSGAWADVDKTNAPWQILGTTTQYHSVQDHAKLKLAYDINPTVRASYTLGYWHNNAEGQSQTYLSDAAGQPVYSGPVAIDGRQYTIAATDFTQTRETMEHLMHGLSVKSRTRGVFDWELAASVYDYQRDQVRTPTVTKPAADNGGNGRITDLHGTGWNTLAAKATLRPGADHVIDAGLQQESYALRQLVSNVTGNWISGDAGSFNSRFEGNTRLRSLWGQDTWTINDAFKTVLGLRVEHWSASNGITESLPPAGASGLGNCSIATGRCTINHPERDKTWVSPKAALGFQAADDWVIKGSVGRAIRLPTVSELYQGGINAQGVTINNNPNLKPERSVTSELSSEWNFDKSTLRTTLFYETTRDALYALLNSATNQSNIQNVDHVRTRGIETAFNAQDVAVRGVDLQGSLTYTDSKVVESSGFVKTPGDVVGKDQIRVPRWRASLLASWRVDSRLSTSLGGRYGSKQFSTLDNSDPNGFAYTASSRYAVADWRLKYQFTRQWSAAVGIDNLFGATYWNFHPYPQRSYSAELKFDL